ncbi:hypothetical protein GCM10010199_44320 [Dactylosporangium roseum]
MGGVAPVLMNIWLPAAVASIAGAVLAAIGGVIAARSSAALDRRTAEVRAVTAHAWVDNGGRFPLVRDVTDPVHIGVHPAASAAGAAGSAPAVPTGNSVPPFVPRDAMRTLCESLEQGGFVLVLGESTAGKSRLAFEAMRSTLPDHTLVVPTSREALQHVVSPVLEAKRCVVWLDDLERYLGPTGLTSQMVTRLIGQGNRQVVLLATMRTQEHAKHSARSQEFAGELEREFARVGRDTIRMARPILLERRWSATELQRARNYTDDSRIADALLHADRFGVAEYIAAGPQLLMDWRDAWSPGAHPRGAAIVAAAVDVRRAGLHRPISADLLFELHTPYLEARGGSVLRPESLEEALRWATQALHATSSLLIPAGGNRYIAFDYLADALQRDVDADPVPEHVWRAVVREATPPEAYDVGIAALQQGNRDYTRASLQSALDPSGAYSAEALAYSLGESGQPTQVKQLFAELVNGRERMYGKSHPYTLAARHSYAYWVGAAGDPKSAADLFRALARDREQLGGRDDPAVLATRHSLAYWVGEAGDPSTAARMFEEVVAERRRVLGPDDPGTLAARHSLAYWVGEAGDEHEAVRQLRAVVADQTRVLGAEHPHTMSSRHDLARRIGQAGDPRTALAEIEHVYAIRLRLHGPDHVYTLAALHSKARWTGEAGDPKTAVALFRQVVDGRRRLQGDDHPDTLYASYRLGMWVGKAGDPEEAVRILQDVAERQSRSLALTHLDIVRSRLELARYGAATGRADDAVRQLEELVESIDPAATGSPEMAEVKRLLERLR